MEDASIPPYSVKEVLAFFVGTHAVSVTSVPWYLIKLEHVPTFHFAEMGFLNYQVLGETWLRKKKRWPQCAVAQTGILLWGTLFVC